MHFVGINKLSTSQHFHPCVSYIGGPPWPSGSALAWTPTGLGFEPRLSLGHDSLFISPHCAKRPLAGYDQSC